MMPPLPKPAAFPRTATHLVALLAATAPEDVKVVATSPGAVAVNVTGVTVLPLISNARKVSPVSHPAFIPSSSGKESSYIILVRHPGREAVAVITTPSEGMDGSAISVQDESTAKREAINNAQYENDFLYCIQNNTPAGCYSLIFLHSKTISSRHTSRAPGR